MKVFHKLMVACLLGASLLATSCNHGIKDRTFREQVKKDFEAKMKLMGNQFFDLASVGKISQPEKEALEFLYAYMPLADVTDYSTKFYLDNVRIGFSCLADTPWGKDISEPLFYHYVMPLRVSDENLDSSRVEFHHTLQPMLEGKDIKQAILDINHWCAEKAACQPTGTRTCSPMTCILNAEGNEEETSILLVNALRSVGIPARMTYREVAKDSLIYRVEAWGQDGWYAMTACKPEPALTPVGLDGQTWTTKVFGFYGPHAAAEEKIKVQDIYYAVVDIDLKFNPKASKPKAPRVTAQMEAKNDTLMAKAKRIRDAYVSTFITFKEASGYADLIRVPYLQAAPILVNSKGNINTVKLFLHDYPDNRALEILEDLTIEDLKDVKMDVLMDSYDTKLSARKPKVGNEYLTPYKKYFLENLPDSLKQKFSFHPKDDLTKGVREIIAWTKNNVKTVIDTTAWYIPMSPVGVWKSHVTDPYSRDMFFVAMVRTFGNEARIDPETGVVQYNAYNEGGVTVPGYSGPVPMSIYKMKPSDFQWIDVKF